MLCLIPPPGLEARGLEAAPTYIVCSGVLRGCGIPFGNWFASLASLSALHPLATLGALCGRIWGFLSGRPTIYLYPDAQTVRAERIFARGGREWGQGMTRILLPDVLVWVAVTGKHTLTIMCVCACVCVWVCVGVCVCVCLCVCV